MARRIITRKSITRRSVAPGSVRGRAPGSASAGVTLREVLALDVMERARPRIVTGGDRIARRVRWVHTSEIAEIGPLLKGGEILLTTGLGIADATSAEMHRYVDQLASKNLCALALELGRTFDRLPAPMLVAAKRCGLPIITLNAVVPFVEITEDVHALILRRRVGVTRDLDELTNRLNDLLLAGAGLGELVGVASEALRWPVSVFDGNDRVVARSGDGPSSAAHGAPFPIELHGRRWGTLVLHHDYHESLDAELLAEFANRALVAISLHLLSKTRSRFDPEAAATAVMAELLEGRITGDRDLRRRLGALDFDLRHDSRLVVAALASDSSSRRAVTEIVRAAAPRLGRDRLIAPTGKRLALIMAVGANDASESMRALVSAVMIECERHDVPAPRTAVIGRPVNTASDLAASCADVLDGIELADQVELDGIIDLPDLDVYRVLSFVNDHTELDDFVEHRLGALIRHDLDHDDDLVRTLATYLHTNSKSGAARSLAIHRQSLYQRLDRIEGVLATSLEQPQTRTTLSLAICAWRLRRSQATADPWRNIG